MKKTVNYKRIGWNNGPIFCDKKRKLKFGFTNGVFWSETKDFQFLEDEDGDFTIRNNFFLDEKVYACHRTAANRLATITQKPKM